MMNESIKHRIVVSAFAIALISVTVSFYCNHNKWKVVKRKLDELWRLSDEKCNRDYNGIKCSVQKLCFSGEIDDASGKEVFVSYVCYDGAVTLYRYYTWLSVSVISPLA